MFDNTVTIMKFKLRDSYQFHVLDKFDVEDEAARLDAMIAHSQRLADLAERNGWVYEQLWIKNTPII